MSDQVREAAEHLVAGQLEQARRLCEQALLQDPGHPEWLHLAGAVAFREGHIETAFQQLRSRVTIT